MRLELTLTELRILPETVQDQHYLDKVVGAPNDITRVMRSAQAEWGFVITLRNEGPPMPMPAKKDWQREHEEMGRRIETLLGRHRGTYPLVEAIGDVMQRYNNTLDLLELVKKHLGKYYREELDLAANLSDIDDEVDTFRTTVGIAKSRLDFKGQSTLPGFINEIATELTDLRAYKTRVNTQLDFITAELEAGRMPTPERLAQFRQEITTP